MKMQRCKGFRDLLPEEMNKFRFVEAAFRNCCVKWCYQEIKTPTLEYLYLFTSTGTLTPSLLNKVYSFLDWDGWSGERVVLRPEGTIPATRLYIDTAKDGELSKYYYVTNTFVFEETGKRSREKWQCGVELIGAGSPLADVELIKMALEVLQNLKLGDIELKLSHAGLIRALLSGLGLNHEEQTSLFDRILDGDIDALTKIKPGKTLVNKIIAALLGLKGKSGGLLKNFKALYTKELPEIAAPLDDFISIIDLLEGMGIKYQIDMNSGQGFEYYTGFVFHLSINGEHVGGGGRYDALIPLMSGNNVPASGFALYLDRLMNMIATELTPQDELPGVLIKVTNNDSGAVKAGFNLADLIHRSGGKAEMDIGGKPPASFNWIADMTKLPTFILTHRANRKKYEVNTITEVLKILQNEKTNKNRVTKRTSSR